MEIKFMFNVRLAWILGLFTSNCHSMLWLKVIMLLNK